MYCRCQNTTHIYTQTQIIKSMSLFPQRACQSFVFLKLPSTGPEFLAFPLVFLSASLIRAIFMHMSSRCIDDMKMLI